MLELFYPSLPVRPENHHKELAVVNFWISDDENRVLIHPTRF